MALKKIIEKLDDVDEALRLLYKESNGKFVLDIEDDGRLNEFRENNKKLFNENEEYKKKLALFDGIDPDEARKTKEIALKMKKKELIEAGEFEKLIEAQLAPIKQAYDTKFAKMEADNAKLTEDKKKLLVDNHISTLAAKHGVVPSAIRNVTLDARETFSVNDKNEMVALAEDGTIKRDSNGDPITPETWFKLLPKQSPHYFAPSSGGGLNESRQPIEHGQIQKGDNASFLTNLEGIASGKVKVAST